MSASPTPASGSPTSPRTGATDLTIVYDDGTGVTVTWTLTCDPAGGTHPRADAACAALAAHGATALPAVPRHRVCTDQYGGPQRATISGTWLGQQVRSEVRRTNGCEIGRWKQLEGLLPGGEV